jgi:hypothetical protein
MAINEQRIVSRMTTKSPSKWWSIIIGTGVALSPIHNQYLTNLLTNSKGETVFFLPAFGYLLLVMGAGLFLLNNQHRVKATGWGDRRIVGCLLFIVLAISASGAAYTGLQDRFAPMGMGLALFALYLCGRVLGKDMFLPLAVGAALASLGVIVHQIVYPGVITGGFVFEDNYDIVVGYVLLGAALWIHKWQWILAGLALVAILLTGSPEGIFAIGVIGLAVLWRRDWGKKLVIIMIPVIIIVVAALVSGYGQALYNYAGKIVAGETASPYGESGIPREAIQYRLDVITDAMTHIRPLGEGYNLTNFSRSANVHNVPLVLIQQLGYPGILAAIAWLFVSVYCLVKTRWRYAWIILLSLCVWDHFIWSQLAPLYWILVGVSTAPNNINSDLLFSHKMGNV